MKIKYFLTFITVLFVISIEAQSSEDEVLFSVAGDPIYVSEFLRVYNKNLDLVQDASQRDVDEYLKLFTTYKLKLKEAKSLKLDEKPSYIKELGNYKKQLANSYIRDSKISDALVAEAYQRISQDINANHILIKVAENANPQDTLVAYNRLLKLRERALAEGFDKVRKEVHNGRTVFGEELGYFTGFRMVYKFENAAFNTPVGEISMPFRTRFGYHIVNVLDKRKSRGERTVAHIMMVSKKGDTLTKPEERIQEIYNKLKQGEEFEALAKQFSDDKNSASRGGKLAPFSSGQIRAKKFEDMAFSLENEGDVSEPFQSQFGWHIVKLLNKKLIPPFEDMKPELEGKVKRDDRSKLIDEALYSSLKKQYGVNENQKALDYFQSILNDTYFKRSWTLPEDFKATENLVKIGNRQFKYSDFGAYLMAKQKGRVIKKPLKAFTKTNYETFLNENLIKYKEANLEKENEEYAHILNEYRDGLLLFDLMENTIWNAAKTDSLEIKDYYTKHKTSYTSPKKIDAVVASSSKQKVLKKVAKLLEKGTNIDTIKKQINSKETTDVIFTIDIMDASNQVLPKDILFKKGISEIYKHNKGYVIVDIKEVLPQLQKSFEEAKGHVISDYQTYKEDNWVNTLKEKYPIKINKEVLKKVKSQIKKQ
ncbi:peptidylprolyl isomerase [Seonamhaeicola marinus]|uniref:Peptidylprolyl isomerase n=1 Tax=Seonamhaeicola marinus TaxID=1912246 RepID=A0A5D0JGM3_9FLAO|nr:peptidylprolyl isomerase [Seonamhaeicola marinus]TYA94776.1 peptidylprolyl isomerase [Seonamhaeicola marinus]